MNLHDKIMSMAAGMYPRNLPRDDVLMAYRMGYRDARRAAADLARQDCEAERERWEMHLSATRKLAEANSKRGDDCGMLARTFLDTLKAMRA